MSEGTTKVRDRLATVRKIAARSLPVLLGLATIPSVIRLVGDHDLSWTVMAVSWLPLSGFVVALLGVLAALLRQRVVAGIAAVVVAANAYWLAPLYVSDDPPRSGSRITAMTVNLRYGLADVSAVMKQVRSRHVDVLALTELTPEAVTALEAAGINEVLPHKMVVPAERAHGGGLWAKWPLTRAPDWEGGIHLWPGATTRIDGQDVMLRVVHPFRISRFGSESYRRDYRLLQARMDRVDENVPTLVMGDFNASRDHSAFRRLLGDRWRDASEYAGSGLQPTWNILLWLPSAIQLDHILMSRQFGARSTDAVDIPGTDHDGMLADLVLAPR